VHTITLGNDIALLFSTKDVFNPNPGVVLLIDGGGYEVNANSTAGVRPFEVAISTTVRMVDITVAGGLTTDTLGGGGILNFGRLTLEDSTVVGNSTDTNGGGIRNHYWLTLTNSTISDNRAGSNGGGIYNIGTVRISSTGIFDNRAPDAGGIYLGGVSPFISVIQSSRIYGNLALEDAGGIRVTSSSLSRIIDSHIYENAASLDAGGVHATSASTLYLINTRIFSNTADEDAGGIKQSSSAYIFADDLDIYGNSAAVRGGALYLSAAADLNMWNTAIYNNSAVQSGGGVYMGSASSMTATNTTISGNRVLTDNISLITGGGAGYINASARLDLRFSSIVSNSAPMLGVRDGLVIVTAAISLRSTILAYHPGGNCTSLNGGLLSSAGYNLEDANSCGVTGTGDQINTDPMLLPLADNGGPTPTHALASGSPAVDVIPNGTLDCGGLLDHDQRHAWRPFGAGCDAGAFELVFMLFAPIVERP
jgi:hypothetical protein